MSEGNRRERYGLTAITIENFKGIGAPVTVPLRPLTLLFGANSAGKSTVIQALQYAWEMLENRNADVDRTRLGGEVIDLGGFRNLVHQHDLSRSISITLEYTGGLHVSNYMSPDVYMSSLHNESLVYDQEPVDVTDWVSVDRLAVRVTSAWDPATSRAFVSAYEVDFNDQMFGRIEDIFIPTGDKIEHKGSLLINADHPFLSEHALEGYEDYAGAIMRALYEHFTTPLQDINRLTRRMTEDELEAMLKTLEEEHATRSLSPDSPQTEVPATAERRFLLDNVIPEWGRFLPITKVGRRSEDERPRLEEEVIWVLSQLLLGAGEAVLDALGGLRYLGPLREVPDRLYAVPLHPDRERWANGLGAWDALVRNTAVEGNSPSLVEQCSEYINETLGLGYTLRREDRIQLPAEGILFSQLRLFAAQFEDSEANDLRRVVSQIEGLERIPMVQLHDEKNNIDVAPMDIGVGVSQTLPVVVGAVEPNCTIFAVEQPELHLHPAGQSRMGDVFILEALKQNHGRLFLIETHSEHIILRILRRIRQTTADKLEPGYPEVHPEDVQVLYVKPDAGEVAVYPQEITPDGDFATDWPDGFFIEREEDLFE